MPDMPAAEVNIAPEVVRRLLASQHPDIAGLPLSFLASGWDNLTFRLGSDMVVRLPRREAAVPLLLHELRWLPIIAASTTTPVPVPLRRGAPSDLFPWPWSVNSWHDGEPVLALEPSRRAGLAPALARFVTDIHREAPPEAPRNPVRGTPLAARDADVRARLAGGILDAASTAALTAAWEDALAAPPHAGPACWIHGDLHPANMLHRGGELAAVIDFGDLGRGDPATDLGTAWLTFDAEGRTRFRAEVAAVHAWDDAMWTRARGWAVSMTTALLAFSDDAPAMRAMGLWALAQVLDD
jgi:aminoglycoside phosphotransferase (APT) family kinase protein